MIWLIWGKSWMLRIKKKPLQGLCFLYLWLCHTLRYGRRKNHSWPKSTIFTMLKTDPLELNILGLRWKLNDIICRHSGNPKSKLGINHLKWLRIIGNPCGLHSPLLYIAQVVVMPRMWLVVPLVGMMERNRDVDANHDSLFQMI